MKKTFCMFVFLGLMFVGVGCAGKGLWKSRADRDGDGVYDKVDNCSLTYNRDQSDKDDDGVGDACDNCPIKSNRDQADADGDGLGDVCEPDYAQTLQAGETKPDIREPLPKRPGEPCPLTIGCGRLTGFQKM
jgi:hypothetical protein